MKILEIKSLSIPAIKVIRFARFMDHRGYFTEPTRKSDLDQLDFLKNTQFVQVNESFSRPTTVRGLHFQWNPFMGKLVRTISGRMVDIVLDIRKGSPTFGKAIAYDLPTTVNEEYAEWIWVPPGFAHGNYFTEATLIEYFCSGEYSPNCEAGISPLAPDIDWSLCDPKLKEEYDAITSTTDLITEKDRNAMSVEEWSSDDNSYNFLYNQLEKEESSI